MWYSNLYRRHLLDMHIEDWDESFLSRFSPEQYVRNLKLAGINYAMIYLQSHAGLCYWPTRTGVMHRALKDRPDLIRRTIEMAQQEGIRVIGYYSLIYNTREHDRHPDWRLLLSGGKSNRQEVSELLERDPSAVSDRIRSARYGHVCPNNADYRAFVHAQIDEMAAYFPVDGLFFDMPFWPLKDYCHCESCRRLYQKRYQADIPLSVSEGSEEEKRMIRFKTDAISDLVRDVTNYVRQHYPNLVVEHNFASSLAGQAQNGCGRAVGEASDYVGGDLYGDLYYHSFTCKYLLSESLHMPFENMFSRCKPNLLMHTLTKTEDQMKTSIAATMAHHGATLVIDAIDPVGTMDTRVYSRLGRAFAMEEAYEPFLKGTSREEVGILFDSESRFQEGDHPAHTLCCVEMMKTLIGGHVLCGVVGKRPLTNFRLIAAPETADPEGLGQNGGISNEQLISYVENGGTLFLTGSRNPALIEQLTGGRFCGRTAENRVYLAPIESGIESLRTACQGKQSEEPEEGIFGDFNRQYPMPFEGSAPLLTGAAGRVLATITLPYTRPDEVRFASIHSDPPGVETNYPALLVQKYGKGTLLWSAVDIQAVPIEEYRRITLNLLKPYLHSSVETDAPEHVEMEIFDQEKGFTISFTALDEHLRSAEVPSFSVAVTSGKPKALYRLPGKEAVPFSYREVPDPDGTGNGKICFYTEPLHIFDMYEIELT